MNALMLMCATIVVAPPLTGVERIWMYEDGQVVEDNTGGLNCDAMPPGCTCCGFGTALGATTQPVNNFEDFLTFAIPSGTELPEGTIVYPTAIVGNQWTSFDPPSCDGCEGTVTITYPDDSQITIEHGPFPRDAASDLDVLVISFPGWALSLPFANEVNCGFGPCCPNTFHSFATGILVAGEGSATTAWPVLTIKPDVNSDGIVNVLDIIDIIINWETTLSDTGCDQNTDIDDLLNVLEYMNNT